MYRTGSLEKVHSYVSKVFTWLHLFQNYPREYQHRKLLFYVIALEFGINKIMQTTIFFLQKQLTGRILELSLQYHNMSRVEKTGFRLCKNKGADQLHSNCEADLRLCFHFMDSTIPLLLIFKRSVVSGLVGTPKTGFLTSPLIFSLPMESGQTALT